MIDQAKLEELKRLAMAATGGPWEWGPVFHGEDFLDGPNGTIVLYPTSGGYGSSELSISSDNRKYIAAANPATMLELIAEIARLNERIDDLNDMTLE